MTGAISGQSSAFVRRHIPTFLVWVALAGVPIAVIATTGGLHTIGFWIRSLIMIPATMIGLVPLGATMLLVLAPIIFVLDKLFPQRIDWIVQRGATVFWITFTLVGFVVTFDIGSAADVRLPTPWPSVGALAVMLMAATASFSILHIARRLDTPKAPPGQLLPQGHARNVGREPKDVFWSDDYVIGCDRGPGTEHI